MHHLNERFTRTARLAGLMLAATLVLGWTVPGSHAASKGRPHRADDVETRIKTLHSQLHITPAQQPAWDDVAQVMRENAKAMAEQHGRQVEAEKSASAPDMLTTYAKTMDTHAESIHKFIPIFQKLYDGMSDAQKKTADVVFRERIHTAASKKP